jgi:serine/threonine protein kinase
MGSGTCLALSMGKREKVRRQWSSNVGIRSIKCSQRGWNWIVKSRAVLLLKNEVQALIDAHLQANEFIQTPVVRDIALAIGEEDNAIKIDQQIGSYKILKEIGRGGMGAVYLAARADQEFKKQVAIKLIKRGMDTDRVLRRFRNERQILANFDHPNIARLLEGGSTSNGLPYFVMEYVEGRPIDVYCDENNLSISDRLKLFLQRIAIL